LKELGLNILPVITLVSPEIDSRISYACMGRLITLEIVRDTSIHRICTSIEVIGCSTGRNPWSCLQWSAVAQHGRRAGIVYFETGIWHKVLSGRRPDECHPNGTPQDQSKDPLRIVIWKLEVHVVRLDVES
jgi:hypothetical protein